MLNVDLQAKYYNRTHKPLVLRRGELVGLSTKNIRFKGLKPKLIGRRISPFRILEVVESQAYRLALSIKYHRLYNVFPVSALEPWRVQDPGKNDINLQKDLRMPDLDDNKERIGG
jgi:hypothetical protein